MRMMANGYASAERGLDECARAISRHADAKRMDEEEGEEVSVAFGEVARVLGRPAR